DRPCRLRALVERVTGSGGDAPDGLRAPLCRDMGAHCLAGPTLATVARVTPSRRLSWRWKSRHLDNASRLEEPMTAFDTAFTRLIGIDVPIVQAPIGGLSTPALAAAVSNAGALGTLSVTWRDPDLLRELLAETRRLTERPFGVNLVLEWPPD